jgi:hypothetical protein
MRRRDLGETLFSPVQLIIILQLVSVWYNVRPYLGPDPVTKSNTIT